MPLALLIFVLVFGSFLYGMIAVVARILFYQLFDQASQKAINAMAVFWPVTIVLTPILFILSSENPRN